MWSLDPCLQSSFTMLSRNSGVWVHSQIWKVVTFGWTSGPHQPGSRTHLPGEGPGPPSQMEYKIPDWAHKLMELKTLWCWKQTHKSRENLDKAISFDQKGASMCSLHLRKHINTKRPTVDSPYIPDAVVPAPHNLSWLVNRIWGGLWHTVWQAMELCRNPEEKVKIL
jgi:hypothetical protein